MNWNEEQGNRKKSAGKSKRTRDKFTDFELDQVAGKHNVFVGQNRTKYRKSVRGHLQAGQELRN